jgi:UDP:flavonoid glycosyltransferase YjiC (YdhE family)
MSRYLAYTSPARGHLYPITGALIELRRRGHEVAVRTLASEVERMEELGLAAASPRRSRRSSTTSGTHARRSAPTSA